ncbi:MAG: tetratricopeptide repeat protein [Acidobacteriota bacterium]|nr:tetratricopeptide repeat protein [Acidobacteriota bacterium]
MILALLCFHGSEYSFACTIFVKADGETILVGNNEDYYDPRTKIWFHPPEDQLYGHVIWGYDRYLSPNQGGMNDRGLFIDINAIGFTGWKKDPAKADFDEDPVSYILTRFGTVDEVIQFFRQHNIALDYVKYVFADAGGRSAVFEWLNDKLNVVERVGDYQISTNYLSPKDPTEPRYQIAEKILQSQARPTVGLMRKVLAATSYDVHIGQTLYSTICDLKNKKIYLYHFHYFEEVKTFDLSRELEKGGSSYAIPSLFSIKTHNEFWFNHGGTQLGARDLMHAIEEKGIGEGIAQVWKMKERQQTFRKYDFPEWSMRSMGLNYLSKQKPEEALAVFKLITRLYPNSWQAHVDLARVQLENGRRADAIQSYRKALEINPGESAVIKALRKLQDE